MPDIALAKQLARRVEQAHAMLLRRPVEPAKPSYLFAHGSDLLEKTEPSRDARRSLYWRSRAQPPTGLPSRPTCRGTGPHQALKAQALAVALDRPTRQRQSTPRPATKRYRALGITQIRTPFRSPQANSIAERWVKSLRRECLDYMFIFNECHLRAVLAEYVRYFNRWRPHRAIGQRAPCALDLPICKAPDAEVIREPVLGGLHHVYHLAA